MLQIVESECRQVYLSVVRPLLAQRLTGMMEHGDFTAEVRLFKREKEDKGRPARMR